MISRLTGTLVHLDPTEIVLDVHGVGYAVTIPLSSFDRMPPQGATVTLYTHLAVREDAFVLYGFVTQEERALFRMLMGVVTGIGPRIALNVLSAMPVRTFCEAVAAADLKALSRINGIGKRSAERMVVELRDRIAEIAPEAAFAKPGAAESWSREAQDAVAALETLGFRSDAARQTVKRLCAEAGAAPPSTESLIR
ncbi:MAG: Holliday junction branch migration protein RuvA, partial [Lentisphaeria bacterium]|nr:Holliday junction branch migration protein RuvA [Lentisphaeria bacterium]